MCLLLSNSLRCFTTCTCGQPDDAEARTECPYNQPSTHTASASGVCINIENDLRTVWESLRAHGAHCHVCACVPFPLRVIARCAHIVAQQKTHAHFFNVKWAAAAELRTQKRIGVDSEQGLRSVTSWFVSAHTAFFFCLA